jgi:zinc protease
MTSVPESRRTPFLAGLAVEEFSFENGLSLLVIEDHAAPVVSWQTWFRVGSAWELPGKTGLSHLLEHLMFRATEDYVDGHFSAVLEAAGAEGLNAWTWLDETVYTESVPRSSLELVAELESSRMHRLKLDETVFRNELQVVLNEQRYRVENDPDGQLSEALFARAFDRHPYRWPTIGLKPDLEAFVLSDVEEFYRAWYGPSHATIVIAGDVSGSEAVALVAERFGAIPRSARAPVSVLPVEPTQIAQRRVTLELPVRTDRCLVGLRGPSYGHDDVPALLLLAGVLTGGRSSRLRRHLEDAGLAASVGAHLLATADPGLLEFSLTCRPGVKAEHLYDAFEAQIREIRDVGVSPAEVERARNLARTQVWGGLSGTAGKAEFIGENLVCAGSWLRGLEHVRTLETIDADAVSKVAKRCLDPDAFTIAIGHAAGGPGIFEPVAPEADDASEALHLSDRPVRVLTPPPEKILEASSSGAKLAVAHDDALPLVWFRFAFPTGAAADPVGREGLASVAVRMMLRGTRGTSRKRFEEALEDLGAHVGASAGADSMAFSGVAPSATWPAVLDLLEDAFSEPAFRADDLDLLRRKLRDAIRESREEDDALVRMAFREALLGPDHPYSHGAVGTDAGLVAITADDCRDFWEHQIRAEGAFFGAAGQVGQEGLDDLARLAGALAGRPPVAPALPPPPEARGRRVLLVDKPERTQVQVLAGRPGMSRSDPSLPAFLLGNEVFGGGSFSARLMREIREKRGWSYGAYSSLDSARGPGAWAWWIFPAADQAHDAIALALSMQEDASREPPGDDELEQARSTLVRSAPFLLDTADKRLDLALERHLLGYDRLELLEAVAKVDRGAVAATWRKWLGTQDLLFVVVCTASDFREKLSDLGPVEILPFDRVAAGPPGQRQT